MTKPELALLSSTGISILMYHRVGLPVVGSFANLTIEPLRFVEQMDWLAHEGFTVLGTSEVVEAARANALPEKTVVLTFDDAYESNMSYAVPVLAERGFGATIFVVSKEIGGHNRWDWDKGSAPLPLMSSSQVREAFAAGIEIGAHSRTHPNLKGLAAAALESEVIGSRDDLSALLGSPVISFAYPFGYFDQRVLEVVMRAYRFACTTEEGLSTSGTPLHELRRTMVCPGESLREFAWRVRRGRNPAEGLRAAGSTLKRRLLRVFA